MNFKKGCVPPDSDYALTGVFEYGTETVVVWTNYQNGHIEFTSCKDIPQSILIERPLMNAFFTSYQLDDKKCAQIYTYGPAAGGIGEAGAFRILTCGERIEDIAPYLGFKRKRNIIHAIDKKTVYDALPSIARLCGQFSASYTALLINLAFNNVSEEYEKILLIAVELERLHNHIWVIHKLASDAAQKIASAHFAALTENLLRLNAAIFGSRYLMNISNPRISKEEKFKEKLTELKKEFNSLVDELLRTRIFIDRLHTTCTLTDKDILLHDIMGIPARASGVPRDSRKFGVLAQYYRNFKITTESYGDSLARLMVRVNEIETSFEIIENVDLPKKFATPEKPSDGFRYGMIEAPPGDIFMALEIENGRIKWFRIRPPSLVMLHAFSVGVRKNVFTDFPFALDSFGAYFADADLYRRR